jgi:hypothetical protein
MAEITLRISYIRRETARRDSLLQLLQHQTVSKHVHSNVRYNLCIYSKTAELFLHSAVMTIMVLIR